MAPHKRTLFVAASLALALATTGSQSRAFCRSRTCQRDNDVCQVDAQGCPTSGEALAWAQRSLPLSFRFSSRGTALLVNEEARAAIRAAFYRWSDVQCPGGRTSLRFREDEDLATDKPLSPTAPRPAPFGIYFRDNGWPHDGVDSKYAQTNRDFGVRTGTISYVDIELNTSAQQFSLDDSAGGVDLQTVMTHEVGHYIGLGHSRAPNSIMGESLCSNGDRCLRDRIASRRLGDDDRAAVCALYPPGLPTAAAADDEGTGLGGCASSPAPPSAWALLVAVGLFRRRSRRVAA